MRLATAILAAAVLCASPAIADTLVPAPAGASLFCSRNASFCTAHAQASVPVSIFDTLYRVNGQVNDPFNGIVPEALNTSAQKLAENNDWRVVMPGGVGACADYVWTKYALLAWAGVPLGAMQPAEVRTPDGALHMVLLVRVKGIVEVLDNLTPIIWPADAVKYQWLAVRQADGFGWAQPDGAPK